MNVLSLHVTRQQIRSVESFAASCVGASERGFRVVVQFVTPSVFGPCEDLLSCQRQFLGRDQQEEPTLLQPGNSHACTRFPFLALLIL